MNCLPGWRMVISMAALAACLQGCGEYGAVDCSSQSSYDHSLADVLSRIDDRYPGQSVAVREFLHDKSGGATVVKEVCDLDAEHLAALGEKYAAKGTMGQLMDTVSSGIDEAGKAVENFLKGDDNSSGKPVKPAAPSAGNPKSEFSGDSVKTYTVPKVDCRYGDFYQKSLDAVFRDLGSRSPSAAIEVKKRLRARHQEAGLGNAMDQELCDRNTHDLTAFLAPDLVNDIDWTYKTDAEVSRDSWRKAGADLSTAMTEAGKNIDSALSEAGKSIDNALTEAGDALESGWNNVREGVDGYFDQRRADKEKAKKEQERHEDSAKSGSGK